MATTYVIMVVTGKISRKPLKKIDGHGPNFRLDAMAMFSFGSYEHAINYHNKCSTI